MRKFIFLLLFCLMMFVIRAQHPHPSFKHYSTDQGLPSPEVYCAFQDSKGYMWFGTDNGVSRFDGYEFRNFTAEDGLKNNVVFDIIEDKNGAIWFLTMSANIYIYSDEHIVPYIYNNAIQQHKKTAITGSRFFFNQTDEIVLKFDGQCILIIDTHGTVTIHENTTDSLAIILYESTNNIIGSSSINLNAPPMSTEDLSKRTSFPFHFISRNHSFKKSVIWQQTQSDLNLVRTLKLNNGLILVYYSNYIYLFEHEKLLWSKPYPYFVSAIRQNTDGQIFQAEYTRKGIKRYADMEAFKEGDFTLLFNNISVSDVIQDREGGHWFTTLEQGVFYSPATDLKVYDEETGLTSEVILSLTVKNECEIVMGLQDGNILELDLSAHAIKTLPRIQSDNKIIDLLYIANEDLLIAANGILQYLDHEKWHLFEFPVQGYGLQVIQGKRLSQDTLSGSVWCGSTNNFHKVNTITKSAYLSSFDCGIVERTLIAFQDRQQRVWIGNTRGLFEFKDSSLLKPQPYFPEFSVRVDDILDLPDSSLIIATKGIGLIIWKDSLLIQLTKKDGLTSNMLECIHYDAQGNIWAGSMNGINLIRKTDNGQYKIRKITTAHGLPSNEIHRIKSIGKQIWVATSKGLVNFSVQPENTTTETPRLTQITVNNSAIDLKKALVVSHNENNLQFRFLAFNYKTAGKIPYRYRLTEDNDWNYTQNTTINLTAISPRKYLFEVQAQNEDGYWSTSATFPIHIKKPFWWQWWFHLMVIIAAFIIFSSLVNWKLREGKRKETTKKQLYDLEQAAFRAQMNPHFIFNCLNSIQALVADGETEDTMHYIGRFAHLVRSTLHFAQSTTIALDEELALLENYLTLEKLRHKDSFDFSITVHENIVPEDIDLPPMLLQPFVENAIVHGFSQKNKKGKVCICFSANDDTLSVEITDNGIGFLQSQKLKTKNTASLHKSIGMTLTHKRLELLHEMQTSDFVVIEEIKGKEGDVLGTRVIVKIPIT